MSAVACGVQNWVSDSPRPEVSAINYLSQCWEPNSGHLQEQYTILTAEPSPWALAQAILKWGF